MERDGNEGTGNVVGCARCAWANWFPDYELGAWAETGDWTAVADDDVSRDRMAHIHDNEPGIGTRGTFTHYVTDESFAKLPTGNDPNDARWRCATWHRLAADFVAGCSIIVSREFIHADPPIVGMQPKRDGGLYTFSVTWRLPRGGVQALNLDDIGPCQGCLGCDHTSGAGGIAESWVYFIQAAAGGPVKIGRSTAPRARLASLQTANAAALRIVAMMPGGGAVERAMHATFAADRARPGGEWFRPSPSLAAFVKEIGGKLA